MGKGLRFTERQGRSQVSLTGQLFRRPGAEFQYVLTRQRLLTLPLLERTPGAVRSKCLQRGMNEVFRVEGGGRSVHHGSRHPLGDDWASDSPLSTRGFHSLSIL